MMLFLRYFTHFSCSDREKRKRKKAKEKRAKRDRSVRYPKWDELQKVLPW